MIHMGVTKMPDAYILRRWTPNAEVNQSTISAAAPQGEMPDESRKKMKYAVYCNDLTNLAKVACQSDDGQRILSMHIKQLKTELNALKKRQQRTAAAARATTPSTTRGPSVSVRKRANPSAGAAPSQGESNAAQPNATTAASRPVETACPTGTSIVLVNKQTMAKDTNANTTVSGSSDRVVLHDPPMSNTKGRKKAKAFQNPLDIQVKNKRKCKKCGSVQHDARNCPDRFKEA